MKNKLDNLVKKYETVDFIKNDPIQFPHRYIDKKDIEISALISALFSFGKRELFIKKLEYIFSFAQPYELICDFRKYDLSDFLYRFIKSADLIEAFKILNKLYCIDKIELEEMFLSNISRFQKFSDYFYKNCSNSCSQGFCFMFAKPENGSAMKRMNMFLRWLVRKSDVDLGIWENIKKSDLIIPLDTHVARISRQMGLLKRKQNDYKSALELTQKLKEFDENDPVKYDFALFGYGIENPI